MRDVIGHMTEMVEETVKLYKGDFYNEEYGDLARIKAHGLPCRFVWGVRDAGTHLFFGDGAAPEHFCAATSPMIDTNTWYLVAIDANGNGAIEQGIEKCRNYVDSFRRERDRHVYDLIADGKPIKTGGYMELRKWAWDHRGRGEVEYEIQISELERSAA